MDGDLSHLRGARPVESVSLEDGALDLPPLDGSLHDDLGVMRAGGLDGRFEVGRSSTFEMPMEDPALAGLTKSG